MTSNLQLFLNRFITVNKERYKDDPDIAPIFNTLTLEDIIWDFVTVNQTDVSKRISNFHSDTLLFTAKDQQWNCVELTNPALHNLTDIKDTIDIAKAVNTAGVYLYKENAVNKMLVLVDKDSIANNTAKDQTVVLLKAIMKYDFKDSAVTIKTTNSDNLVMSVLAECFYGETVVYETTTATGGGEDGDGDETTPEEEATKDPTGGGEFSGVGDAGFGMLTEPRTITNTVANIPDILLASLGIVGAPAPVVELLNENA